MNKELEEMTPEEIQEDNKHLKEQEEKWDGLREDNGWRKQ